MKYVIIINLIYSGILLDCGCNILRRLDQLFGKEQRDSILHRLLLVVISHPHFDHYSYLLSLLTFYQSHPRSFPLVILLPLPLYSYVINTVGISMLNSTSMMVIPFQDNMINTVLPLNTFYLNTNGHLMEISERLMVEGLLRNIGIKVMKTQHCQNSFAIVRKSA